MRYRSDNSTRTITVKYDGKCACCGAVIKRGELADYYPSRKQIAHVGGLDGNSGKCAVNIRNARDFIDVDRMYEDQCADICGR